MRSQLRNPVLFGHNFSPESFSAIRILFSVHKYSSIFSTKYKLYILGRSVKTENRLIVTLEAGKVAFWLQYQVVKILERSVDVFCLRREVKVSKF